MGVLQELGQLPKCGILQRSSPYFCSIYGTERYGQWEFSKNLGSPKCISLISAQYMALRGLGSGSSPRTWAAQSALGIFLPQYMALGSMGSGSSPRTWAAQSVLALFLLNIWH